MLLAPVPICTVTAAPIRTLSGLNGVTFYQLTSAVTSHIHIPNGAAMTTGLAANLTHANRDFVGAPAEFYDACYSNANGAPNIDGEYISIEAYYAGAGLNIGEVELQFGDGPSLFPNSVASFVSASGYQAANRNNILDGNINTATGKGTTNENRMRITDRRPRTLHLDAQPRRPRRCFRHAPPPIRGQ